VVEQCRVLKRYAAPLGCPYACHFARLEATSGSDGLRRGRVARFETTPTAEHPLRSSCVLTAGRCGVIECFGRPIASSPRKAVMFRLAFEIHDVSGELRLIHVIESVDIDDGIATTFDRACYDRRHPARRADVEVSRLSSKSIVRHPRGIGDAHAELPLWV
jgi:hypothetical protein